MQQDFSFDESTLDNQSQGNRYAMDHKLHVTFYTRAVPNNFKSIEAGRKVFDEVDYIRIHTPGSQLNVIDAPITAGTYRQRFADKYEKWKKGQADLVSGTPLDAFPLLLGKVALIAELRSMNIHTVEQLAGIPDSAVQKIMGGNELRSKAQTYLDKTSGTDAVLAKMQKENEDLKLRLDNLTTMFSTKEQNEKKAKAA
jgi:hypothetical protein